MIPNVGDINFYLKEMINDLTSDLLLAFGSLAGQLELRTAINGPFILAPQFSADINPNALGQRQMTSLSLMTESPNKMLMEMSQQESTASLSSPTATNKDKVRRRTPGRAQKLVGDIYFMVGHFESSLKYYASAIDAAKGNSDYQWLAASMEGHIAARLMFIMYSQDLVKLLISARNQICFRRM
jgi:hypothetical protein